MDGNNEIQFINNNASAYGQNYASYVNGLEIYEFNNSDMNSGVRTNDSEFYLGIINSNEPLNFSLRFID